MNDIMLESPYSSKEAMLEAKKQALKKHEMGESLTLEETAFALWDPEHDKKPLSAMGVLKIERRALDKMKLALKKCKISSLDDVFDPFHRELGKQESTREH